MDKYYKILLRKMINSTNPYNRLVNYGICRGYLKCMLDKRTISVEEFNDIVDELVASYTEITLKK